MDKAFCPERLGLQLFGLLLSLTLYLSNLAVLSALPGKAPMSQDYFISFNCVRFMALEAWSLELEA